MELLTKLLDKLTTLELHSKEAVENLGEQYFPTHFHHKENTIRFGKRWNAIQLRLLSNLNAQRGKLSLLVVDVRNDIKKLESNKEVHRRKILPKHMKLKTDDDEEEDEEERTKMDWIMRWFQSMDSYTEAGFGIAGAMYNTISSGHISIASKILSELARAGYIDKQNLGRELGDIMKASKRISDLQNIFRDLDKQMGEINEQRGRLTQEMGNIITELQAFTEANPARRGADPQNIRQLKSRFFDIVGRHYRKERDNLPDPNAKIGLMDETDIMEADIKTQKDNMRVAWAGEPATPRENQIIPSSLFNEGTYTTINNDLMKVVLELRNFDRRDRVGAERLERLRNMYQQRLAGYGRRASGMINRILLRNNINPIEDIRGERMERGFQNIKWATHKGILSIEGYMGGKLLYNHIITNSKRTFNYVFDAIRHQMDFNLFGFSVTFSNPYKSEFQSLVESEPITIPKTEQKYIYKIESKLDEPKIKEENETKEVSKIYEFGLTRKAELTQEQKNFNEIAKSFKPLGILKRTRLNEEQKNFNQMIGRENMDFDPKLVSRTINKERYFSTGLKDFETRGHRIMRDKPIEAYAGILTKNQIYQLKDQKVLLKANMFKLKKKKDVILQNKKVGKCCIKGEYKDFVKVNTLM